MKNKDKFMLACGICAGAAAKKTAELACEYVKRKGNIVVKAGCTVLSWYIGASAGFGVIGMISKIDRMIFGEESENKEEDNGRNKD